MAYSGWAGKIAGLTEENYSKWTKEYVQNLAKSRGVESFSDQDAQQALMNGGLKGDLEKFLNTQQSAFANQEKAKTEQRQAAMAKGYLGLVNSQQSGNFGGAPNNSQGGFGFGRSSLLDFNKNKGGRKSLIGV